MYQLDASEYLAQNGLGNEDLERLFAGDRNWFHRFEFTNGLTTPGRDPSTAKLHGLRLPDRLDGLSVLDIGAYDGFFSFQAEARGAARVVAADHFVWSSPGSTVLDNLRLIKRLVNSKVEELDVSVEDLAPETVGVFDVVLFLGVLYHAPNMVAYLENVRSVTGRFAVIETLVDMLDVDEPCAAFYPPGTLNNDSSNWWGPNLACVEGMLGRAGFRAVQFIGLWDVNTRDALAGRGVHGRTKSGRAVWHAFV